MTVRRGDVYWWDDSRRRRPVAVLTRDSAIPLLSRVVVAPATRTVRGGPWEVRLGPQDGMPSDCALSLDNVRVVPKRALRGRITTLSQERLDEVCRAMAFAFSC